MNSGIEQAFTDWVAAADIDAPVHAGSCAETISNDEPTIIVSVPEVEHVVGPLHKATVHLVVSAPAYHAPIDALRSLAAQLRALAQDFQNNGLATHLTGASFVLGGVFIVDSGAQIEESRWISTLSLTVGLSDAPG